MPRTNGPVQSWSIRTNETGHRSLFLNLATNGIAEVIPFAPDVVRVRFYFLGETNFFAREEIALAKPLTNWPAFSATFTAASPTNFLITTDQLQVEVVFSNRFQVHFKDLAGRDLLRDRRLEWNSEYFMIFDTNAYAQVTWPGGSASVSNRPTGFKLRAVKEMPSNEAYFGLGDEGGPLNRRGRVFQFWTQDTYGFEEFRAPKYNALPFWYGVQGPSTSRSAFAYGIFFHNPARPVVDFSGTNGTYSFEAGDDQMDYFFFGGGASNTMPAVIDRFSELTGRPAFLPKWAYGFHQSRHSYMSQEEVTELMAEFRARDIPCDSIYLDIGAQFNGGQNHQLTFNPVYSNVPALVALATNQGFQLVPIIEPLLTTNDPLYVEAFTNLYFIKTNNLENYAGSNFLGRVSWLDFTIEPTRDWWRGKLTNYLSQYGFQGIWNDLNEPNENELPLDSIWYMGGRYGDFTTNDTRKWTAVNRNTYSLWQAQVSHGALKAQQPSLRPYVLSRSAWPGIQAYAAGWSGDNRSDYAHLRFNTRLGLSVMISGQANYGHDVGGFIGDTTPELLARWQQQGVLHPLYRNHNDINATSQEPWVFGEPYTLFNQHWIKFRYRLMPYLYSLAYEASTNGLPMNVPTVFVFPHDTNTWSQNEYELMAGTHLLAAPVIAQGNTSRSVYLPAGADWHHWETDTLYAGGQTVTVPASLSRLPLFARAGAIIPMGPSMTHVYEFQPAWLDFHVWPGASNRFVLFEDDGRTTNHAAGVHARTPVTVSGSATALTVTVHARSGSYDPGARDFYIVAHALSNVTAVTIDGAPVTRYGTRAALSNAPGLGWAYDTASRRAWAKFGDSGALRTVFFRADNGAPAPASFPSAYTSMAVAGTFTLWNEGAQNMRLVASSQWAFVTALDASPAVEFKFVANNNWGIANWGQNTPTNFTVPLAQTGDPDGANIVLSNLAAGVYSFRFDEATLAYQVTAAAAVDSDGDGLHDEWEFNNGLNPLLASDAEGDLDGDGIRNRDEFIAATQPIDAADYFRVADHALGVSAGTDIRWNAVTGRLYRVYFSTNLLDVPAFAPLSPFSNVIGSGVISVTDTNIAGDRIYRVGVELEP
ncbi:MAG TPA: glycoside hydrolase family 31 protein [Kiritimatiellia bacterium]|nr:glycoside hydrolase family 31 protein [Kiritimatiellia bacterium]